MRKILTVLALALVCASAYSQKCNITLTDRSSMVLQDKEARFCGEYLTLDAIGRLGDNLSVAVRHHLNRSISEADVFDATDWAFFTWTWQDKFELSAGKIVTAYGATENDRNCWDVFIYSANIGRLNRYRPGLNFGYRLSDKDYFQIQLTRSPYADALHHGPVAVNLGWRGFRDNWQPIASCNFFRTLDGLCMHHLAMGNNWTLGDFDISADIAFRSILGNFDYFRGASFTGEFWWKADEQIKVSGKVSLESGFCTVGCGALYYPRNNFRAHAMFYVCNGIPCATIGATWALNILGKNSNIK